MNEDPPAPAVAAGLADRSSHRRGWIDAVLYCVCIALITIVYAFAIRLGANVVVFVLYSLVLSALALMLLTGRHPGAGSMLRMPLTWIAGLATVIIESLYFLLLFDIPPADSNLLVRLSIPLALAAGVVIRASWPPRGVWLGAAIVLAAIIPLFMTHIGNGRGLAVVFTVIIASLVVTRGYAGAAHPANRRAKTIMQRLAVSARVLLITAGSSLALVFSLMLAVSMGILPAFALIPAPAAFLHLPTLVLSLLVGAVILTGMSYFELSAVARIGASNFIATSALMPIATLIAQLVAAAFGLIVVPPLDWRMLVTMAVVIAGVAIIFVSQRRAAA